MKIPHTSPHPPSSSFALLLVLLGLTTGFQPSLIAGQAPALSPGPQTADPPAQPPALEQTLSIVVVAGEDGVNIVKRKTAVAPVVEVHDRNNLPVAGAVVNFSSPNMGPSVTFINGNHTFTAITETNGRATASGVLPVGIGALQIVVTATYDRVVASATIKQTNYETAADASQAGHTVPSETAAAKAASRSLASKGGGLSTGTIAGIAAGVAVAAAIGIYFGVRHTGGSSTTTIGPGTPTVGAPH